MIKEFIEFSSKVKAISDRCLVPYDRERPHCFVHIRYMPKHIPMTLDKFPKTNESYMRKYEVKRCSNCGLEITLAGDIIVNFSIKGTNDVQ